MVLRRCALASNAFMLRLRYQRPDAEKHERENHIRNNSIAEERNGFGIAEHEPRQVLGISDVAERPDSKVAGQEEANACAQSRAEDVQRLNAIAQKEADEAWNKVPAPHHDLVEREGQLIN